MIGEVTLTENERFCATEIRALVNCTWQVSFPYHACPDDGRDDDEEREKLHRRYIAPDDVRMSLCILGNLPAAYHVHILIYSIYSKA